MPLNIQTKQVIDVKDWDDLVEETYGRPYNYQQQDGCKGLGLVEFEVPMSEPEDFDREPWSWHLGHEGRVGQAKDLLVVFSQPIYQWANPANPGSGYAPATLYLRTAITLLDNFTFSPVRSYFSRDTGAGLHTPPRFDLFSDLQEWHYYSYSDKNTVDNFADLQGDANYYINGILQEYQANTPQTVTYAGMKRIDLDGAIQHVHWHVGKSGCTTTASRNNEQIHRVQPLSYRKLMGKLKSGLREQHKHKSTLRSHRRREGGHE